MTATPAQLKTMSVIQLRRYARDARYSSITRLTDKASLIRAIVAQQAKEAEIAPESEPEPDPAPRVENPSIAPAMAAKAQLEAVGWACKGRGYVHAGKSSMLAALTIGTRTWTNMDVQLAAVLATRGDETLSITWADGECVEQKYSIWGSSPDPMVPVGIPSAVLAKMDQLGFDPDELSDSDLIQRLSGMKVTWWNKLGASEESAVVSPMNKGVISVTHFYTQNGQEVTDGRSIQFIDAHGGGFRAFRLASLIKVG